MKSALYWDITQRIGVIPYRRFGKELLLLSAYYPSREQIPKQEEISISNFGQLSTIKNKKKKTKKKPENVIQQCSTAVVPRGCFADPKGSTTSPQEIRGYIYVMTALKVSYF
jgi:hypothetical protein